MKLADKSAVPFFESRAPCRFELFQFNFMYEKKNPDMTVEREEGRI
jgi:hypothetical protein